jgi:hypothetical protein
MGGIQVSYTKYSVDAIALFVLFPMLTGQTARNATPLKNSATPLYWQPNQWRETLLEEPRLSSSSLQMAWPDLWMSPFNLMGPP